MNPLPSVPRRDTSIPDHGLELRICRLPRIEEAAVGVAGLVVHAEPFVETRAFVVAGEIGPGQGLEVWQRIARSFHLDEQSTQPPSQRRIDDDSPVGAESVPL